MSGSVQSGISGAGGAAATSLTFDDTTNSISAAGVTIDIGAQGGDAGFNFGNPSSLGAGGAASAALSVRAAGVIYASASAIGGTGGSGGAASANATAVSTGRAVNVTARAFTGLDNGGSLKAALAQSTAIGSGPGGGQVIATSLSGVKGGLVLSLQTLANAQTASVSTKSASSAGPAAMPALSAGAGDAAFAFGGFELTSSSVAAALSSHTDLAASALDGPTAQVFAAGVLGALAPAKVTGAQEYTSIETLTLNTASSVGHLFLGMMDDTSSGSGFTDLKFSVTAGDTKLLSEDFTSLAAANAFFSNDVVDLGAVAQSASR
jgi:hypothetical protein